MKTRSTSVLSLCLHSLVIVLLGWGCYLLVKHATPETYPDQPEINR